MPLRDVDREQMWLWPPSLDELFPWDHPMRFLAELVDALDRDDWAQLGMEIEGDPLGAPAYHPRAVERVAVRLHNRRALVPEVGDGLPGPDTVSVADRLATPR